MTVLGEVGEAPTVPQIILFPNILAYAGLIAEKLNDSYLWKRSERRSGSGDLISHSDSIGKNNK